MLLVFLMNFLYAAAFPIGKLGLQYAGPFFLLGMRWVMAGLLLLSYYLMTTKKMHRIAPEDWLLMMKTILFYDVLAFGLEYWSMEYISALKTNMLWSSLPFVSALLGYYLFSERITKIKWLGLLVGTLGMIPMMLLPDERHTPLGSMLPEFAMCMVVLATAYGQYLVKRLFDKGYPLVLVNGITMMVGGVVLLTCRFAMLPFDAELCSSLQHVLGYGALQVMVYDIVATGIYGLLLRRYSVTFLSFSNFLCPIFGAVLSKCIFGETLYYHYFISFVLILIGLVLFYRDELSYEQSLKLLR
jgi:drug/metabolite transporter (DMT)-like permease